jgi:hypothetical protein
MNFFRRVRVYAHFRRPRFRLTREQAWEVAGIILELDAVLRKIK